METKNFKLGFHLVALLDVLGQRDRFRGLRLPRNGEQEAQVKEVLRQTAGFVLDLRRVFQNQFEIFEKGVGEWAGVLREKPLRPDFVGFSDSFVTSVPLRNEGGDLVPVILVFSALSAAAVVMLTSLASKHPLRGGIDVGLATGIGPREIYGTALERAYLLEHNVAQYPRIVIGDGLSDYLNSVLAQFETSEAGVAKAITAITRKIMGLITTDTDENKVLDCLGNVVLENADPDTGKIMVQPAYEFALTEQDRVAATGDAKLIGRYASLRSYFEWRLSLWGIPVGKS